VISAGHELIVVRDDGWPGMPAVEEVELWMCFEDRANSALLWMVWWFQLELEPGCCHLAVYWEDKHCSKNWVLAGRQCAHL
jgi:hypothetical protein